MRPAGARPAALRAVIDAGYVLVGGLLAVAAAWPIHQHPQAILVGVAGVLLGTGVAVAGRMLRLPWWTDAAAVALVYLLVAVPLAVPSAFPSRILQGLRDAVFGVVLGWKQLVTLDLPVGDYQAVLVPLLVVTLFGSYAAARVATSARGSMVVPPVLLVGMFGFGVAFGTAEIGAPYAIGRIPTLPLIGTLAVYQALILAAILLVLATLGWLALRNRQSRREALARAAGIAQNRVTVNRSSGWALLRRGGAAVGMIALALAVAGAVAVPAMGLGRDVVRNGMKPVELSLPESSPLSSYRDWIADARFDATLFTVEAPESVDRLRLAVMDDYDGNRFEISDPQGDSRFTRLPGGEGEPGTEVTVTVGEGYAEPWVPTPGDVQGAVEFPAGGDRALELADSVYYAKDQSIAVVLAERPDGSAGLAAGDVVAVSGEAVQDARGRIAAATGGDPIHGVSDETYPQLLAWIAAQAPTSDGNGLLALIDALRSRGYLSHALTDPDGAAWYEDVTLRVPDFEFKESRSGHTTARIEALFAQLLDRERQAGVDADDAALVAGIGDDEQFATAAALIAWAQGFEARVVLGVHLQEDRAMLPPDGSEPSVEACAATGRIRSCEGRNVAAWIEVQVGGQWVPLDTSPQLSSIPQENNEGEQPPPHGTEPERPTSDVIDPPTAARADGDAGAADPEASDGLPPAAFPAIRIAGLSVAAASLVALPSVVLLVGKSVRRTRRRADDPELGIVGAWDEYLDDCLDLGIVEAPQGTRRQIATAIGSPVAAQLAAVADLAVFGDTVPVEEQRELAWSLVERERKALREGVPFIVRLRAALAPTSFLWHARGRGGRGAARPSRAEKQGR